MSCIPGLPLTCLGDATTDTGGIVTGLLGNSFADAMREGAAWVIKTTVGWWIDVPAIDLASSPAEVIRSYVLWLAAAVATGGIVWQGVRLAVSRRPDAAFDAGRGLFLLALWSAVGIVGPAAALRAGDTFSSWVLDEASHGRAADRLVMLASLQGIDSAGAAILLGLLVMCAGLLQAILMMFREGAVVVLAGVVVLAAAGSTTRATRPWLPKVVGWMLALICYKPAAALVYASAITLVGEGDDPRTVVVGLTMMLLAIVALPVLMRLFTWATGAASGQGGGFAAAVGASAAAIHASAMLRSTGGTASSEAQRLRSDLGPVNGQPTGATTTPTSTIPAQTAGATATTSAGASTAAGAGSSGAAAAGGPAGAVLFVAQGAAQAGSAAKAKVDGAINDTGDAR